MISILSNINLDPIYKKVKKQIPCTEPNGYGNILEDLLNPYSAVNTEGVDAIFIIVDLREFVSGGEDYQQRIVEFFREIQGVITKDKHYFISDAEFLMPNSMDYKESSVCDLASFRWNEELRALIKEQEQVAAFPYSALVKRMGANTFYSLKTWYLGSVRHSLEGVKAISGEMIKIANYLTSPSKKVLALDLDNTLWGGVIGEDGLAGIQLSENGVGKAYKDFQEAIKELKESGIILAVVSKNNATDALQVLKEHPHMILKAEDFTILKINWNRKSQSVEEIAKELNVGMDTIVFIDDNPMERSEVKESLPEVECPEFPNSVDKLLEFALDLNEVYFKKISLTKEDKEKTKQYQAREKAKELESQTGDFGAFLAKMEIVIKRKDARENIERLVQLLQKTNQFNTTIKRYSFSEINDMMESGNWEFYFYEVMDKFSNHGLCALAVVNKTEQTAYIDNFVMSCRVMGRNIEFGVLRQIAEELKDAGFSAMSASFRYGTKNMPVEHLFEQAGYELLEELHEEKKYVLNLSELPEEKYVGRIC